MPSRALASLVLALAALIVYPHAVVAQNRTEETFALNLRDVDIHTLIEVVSLRTGKNFIVDPRVQGSVDLLSSDRVDADGLYEIFLSVLAVHGYAAVPAGTLTKIVPTAVGVHSATPVEPAPGSAADELVTRVIPLGHLQASEVVEALRPLVSAPASISAESASNAVVLTDRLANIERLLKLIAEMSAQ